MAARLQRPPSQWSAARAVGGHLAKCSSDKHITHIESMPGFADALHSLHMHASAAQFIGSIVWSAQFLSDAVCKPCISRVELALLHAQPLVAAMLLHRSTLNHDASGLSRCSLPAALSRQQLQSRRASRRVCSCRASLEPQRDSLTEAQQRCLSAKRRDLSDHAQHIPPGSADVQQPQHSRTEEADPQFGAAAGAEPPQCAKVRRKQRLVSIRVPACLHMDMPLHVVSKGFDPGLDACAAMVAAG